MFNPFAKPLDLERATPPMPSSSPHEVPPPCPEEKKSAVLGSDPTTKPDPHASKQAPHAGSIEQNNPSRGPVFHHGGATLEPQAPHGGPVSETENAMGGGGSASKMTMGVWVDEPPFAAELRARYGQMVEQARLRSGGRKVYHQTPKRGLPEPTYDLVGGSVSPEDLHQIDLACLAALYAEGDACFRAGFIREACWVRDTYRARQAEVAAPLLAELQPLRDRWLKAEVRAAQGWDDPKQVEGAYQAMRAISGRIHDLAERLSKFAPEFIPSPLFPLPDEPAEDAA